MNIKLLLTYLIFCIIHLFGNGCKEDDSAPISNSSSIDINSLEDGKGIVKVSGDQNIQLYGEAEALGNRYENPRSNNPPEGSNFNQYYILEDSTNIDHYIFIGISWNESDSRLLPSGTFSLSGPNKYSLRFSIGLSLNNEYYNSTSNEAKGVITIDGGGGASMGGNIWFPANITIDLKNLKEVSTGNLINIQGANKFR